MKVIDIDQIRLIQPALTVLISSTYEGKDALMAAAWVTPVSYIPPRVAVAISPERYTYNIVKGSNMFAINIMEFEYVDSVCKAGVISGREYSDKFSAVKLTKARGKALPIAIVKEAIGVLECKVINSIPTGDHELFIADVILAYVNKDKAYSTHWEIKYYNPVFYISEGHFMTASKASLKKYEIT